jgi:hypothetical protein
MLIVSVFIIGIPLVLIFSPIILIVWIYFYFSNKKFNQEYSDYLKSIEGTNFFCYNNRKNSQGFIEKNIIPILSDEIKLIFLNGRKVESNYEQKFISKTLNEIEDRKGFPYLLKIDNGKIISKSINREFYNVKNQNNDLEKLKEIFNEFYY